MKKGWRREKIEVETDDCEKDEVFQRELEGKFQIWFVGEDYRANPGKERSISRGGRRYTCSVVLRTF